MKLLEIADQLERWVKKPNIHTVPEEALLEFFERHNAQRLLAARWKLPNGEEACNKVLDLLAPFYHNEELPIELHQFLFVSFRTHHHRFDAIVNRLIQEQLDWEQSWKEYGNELRMEEDALCKQ